MQGYIKGEHLVILIDGVVIGCLTDTSASHSADTIDVTCKNAEGNKSTIPGAKTHTFDFSINYNDDATLTGVSYSALFALFDDQTEVTVRWGDTRSGKKYYEGLGNLTSLSATAGNTGTIATATGSIAITGEVTEGTNA